MLTLDGYVAIPERRKLDKKKEYFHVVRYVEVPYLRYFFPFLEAW